MSAIGNLNDYVKFQMAEGMAKGGGAGAPAEMAMGFAMAQEMMKNTNLTPSGPAATPPPLPGATAPAGGVEIMTPAQVAQSLGVTEQDVLASLEAGDIKGKKIGSAWRVTKAALDEFLAK